MFTGIIEEMGRLEQINNSGNSYSLKIACKKILSDIQLGDSIAVNGICLTITNFNETSFTADVMPVTIQKSNLKNLRLNDLVNLERALRANSRFGGHIVSGHIDSTGNIINIQKIHNAVLFSISAPEETLKYLIPEGSICIDGISLTIAKLSDTSFEISLIPHTFTETILSKKSIGDSVNLEVDQIGKYLYNFINKKNKSNITKEFLTQNGFY